jgi:tetratricopeptide (TPR) repeat protein
MACGAPRRDGRFDQALEEERKAQALDPRSLVINAAIGWIQYLARRYAEAEQQLQRTLDNDPAFVPAHLWMGQTLEAMGRPSEARDHYLTVRRLAGTAPTGLGELARAFALSGDLDAARRALGELTATAATRYVEADLFARVHDALGDRSEALRWLERGVEERGAKMTLLGVDPQFDRLRDDPRFQAIVTQLRLPASPAPRQ